MGGLRDLKIVPSFRGDVTRSHEALTTGLPLSRKLLFNDRGGTARNLMREATRGDASANDGRKTGKVNPHPVIETLKQVWSGYSEGRGHLLEI